MAQKRQRGEVLKSDASGGDPAVQIRRLNWGIRPLSDASDRYPTPKIFLRPRSGRQARENKREKRGEGRGRERKEGRGKGRRGGEGKAQNPTPPNRKYPTVVRANPTVRGATLPFFQIRRSKCRIRRFSNRVRSTQYLRAE